MCKAAEKESPGRRHLYNAQKTRRRVKSHAKAYRLILTQRRKGILLRDAVGMAMEVSQKLRYRGKKKWQLTVR